MSDPVASLDGVTVRFGARVILEDISLSLEPGEFWALIGPNGAGKSTLLGLFNGLTGYQRGRVTFRGAPVTPSTARRLRLGVAHVFQMIDIDPKMPVCVFDAVMAGMYGKLGLFNAPRRAERQKAAQALAQVGLAGFEGRPLGQLSGGEKQRVAIARALVQEPDLLILDEPTAALDWQAQREILELVRSIQKDSRQTVVMATHDLNAVSSIVTKVAMLKAGRLIWKGGVGDAMAPDILSKLYGVRISIGDCQGRKVALF